MAVILGGHLAEVRGTSEKPQNQILSEIRDKNDDVCIDAKSEERISKTPLRLGIQRLSYYLRGVKEYVKDSFWSVLLASKHDVCQNYYVIVFRG